MPEPQQSDWFESNKPTEQTDWFAAHAPGAESTAKLKELSLGKTMLKQGLGGAKQLAQDAYGGFQLIQRLQGVPLPDLPAGASPQGLEESTGATLMRVGEMVPAVMAGGELLAGLRSKALVDLSKKTAWNAASKIPDLKLSPAMDLAVENAPVVGRFYKLAKLIKGKFDRLPTADELAAEAFQAKYGVKPVGKEAVTRARIEYDQFRRGLAEVIKKESTPPPLPQGEPPIANPEGVVGKPKLGKELRKFTPSTPERGAVARPERVGGKPKEGPSSASMQEEAVEPPIANAEHTPSGKIKLKKFVAGSEPSVGSSRTTPSYGKLTKKFAAEDASAEEKAAKAEEVIEEVVGKAKGAKGVKSTEGEGSSGVVPIGKLKLRGDIFANVDQIAEKAGVNKTQFKKSFRTIVEGKFGKGISEMSEDELMQVANSVQELLK